MTNANPMLRIACDALTVAGINLDKPRIDRNGFSKPSYRQMLEQTTNANSTLELARTICPSLDLANSRQPMSRTYNY